MPLDPTLSLQAKPLTFSLGDALEQAQQIAQSRVATQVAQQNMARQQQADQITEAKRKSDLVVQTLQGVNDPESFAIAKEQIGKALGPDAAAYLGDSYSPGRVRQVLSSHMQAHDWLTAQNDAAMEKYRGEEIGIQKATGERADKRADQQAVVEQQRYDAQVARDTVNAENIRGDNERANRQLTAAAAAQAETARHNQAMEARPVAGAAGRSQDVDDAESIADAIAQGEQPPITTGLFRLAGPVRSALAKKGYNLATANLDWTATQKHVSTLNSTQQTRLNQSINALPDLLDSVDALASQWKGGRFPILNKANLALAKNGVYGPDVTSVARKLDQQIADVVGDLGAVYMGGNSPTDHAIDLAKTALASEWDEKTLHDMVKQAKSNVAIRQNSIRNTGVQGASSNNPYAPTQPAAPSGMIRAKDPQGNIHEAPAGTAVPKDWTVLP